MTSARSLPSTTRSRTHDHVRVVQAEQRGALLHEAADELLVGGEVLAQQLDGDGPLGSLAQPHRAGAAPPQDLVAVYRLPIFRAKTAPQRLALACVKPIAQVRTVQEDAGAGMFRCSGWRDLHLYGGNFVPQKSTSSPDGPADESGERRGRARLRESVAGHSADALDEVPDRAVAGDEFAEEALGGADPVRQRGEFPDQPGGNEEDDRP